MTMEAPAGEIDRVEPTAVGRRRRHVWIDDDHWEWLGERFGDTIGRSAAIRLILDKFRKGIEAKAAAVARPSADLLQHIEEDAGS